MQDFQNSRFIGIFEPNMLQIIEKLHNFCLFLGIINVTGLRKVKWDGHVTCVAKIKILYGTWVGIP